MPGLVEPSPRSNTVASLSHLGLPQNTPPENRRLAIELVGLVVA